MALLRRALKGAKLPDRPPLGGGYAGLGLGGSANPGGSPAATLGAYASVGTLFAVVNRIAESVALCDWNLSQQQPNGERVLIDDATAPARHEGTAIWTHPNPYHTRQEFLQTSQQHVELMGESYWLICQAESDRTASPAAGVSAGIELWPLRPDRVTPIPSVDSFLAGYVYKAGAETVPLDKAAVVHLRVPNPADPYRGYGPVQALMTDLDAEKLAAQYNRNYFFTGAEPGGIIQFDTPLSDTDFERLVMRWREQHQGVANAHRVAILERGTWVDRKVTMRDMAWQQLRHVNRDLILLAFGMHAAIMGISEGVNRANAEAAEIGFSRWLLRPRLERIKHALNERVLPYVGENLTMDYVDPTPSDAAQLTNQATAGYVARILGFGEARALMGYPAELPASDHTLPDAAQPAMPVAPPKVPTQLGAPGAVAKTLDAAVDEMSAAWQRRFKEIGEEVLRQVEAG
jgi:HK97 family phage portal protein